jgi:hypothetical protein
LGVGLFLEGTFAPPSPSDDPARAWLDGVERWLHEETDGHELWGHFWIDIQPGTRYDDYPGLFVQLHPAAEEVEILVPSPGRLIVSAKTSTVGPGYHIALCKLLHRLADRFQIQWDPPGDEQSGSQDESGYFFHGDPSQVQSTMLQHLRTVAQVSIEMRERDGHVVEAWHLPIDRHRSEYPGGVHTPLGVRSEDWVRAVSADPAMGIDIYPWWDEEFSASTLLGLALYGLWNQVCWRPILDEEEYDAWDYLCEKLVDAYQLDPTLAYPWRSWLELIELLDAYDGASQVDGELKAEIQKRANHLPQGLPLIGYRRYPVRVDLAGGWSIRIPGAMKDVWDDSTWSAGDGRRTVWFAYWELALPDGSPVPAVEILTSLKLPAGDAIEHPDGHLAGKAMLDEVEENGETLHNLKAFSVLEGRAAMCNVYFADHADYDWALETWHSLTWRPQTTDP